MVYKWCIYGEEPTVWKTKGFHIWLYHIIPNHAGFEAFKFDSYPYIYIYIIYIYYVVYIYIIYRRKFRSQTSDNMDRWKAEQGRGREKRKIRRKKSRRERVRRKKMQMREKVGKSRNTVFFQWFGSGGWKSRLAKAAGAEPAGHRRDEKLHAVVARSTFRSQKC